MGVTAPPERTYDAICRTCFHLAAGEAGTMGQEDALDSGDDITSEESFEDGAVSLWALDQPGATTRR